MTPPVVVLDRRDRQRHFDALAVGAHAHGFEMFDPMPGFQAGDDAVFFGEAFGRDHQRDMAANRVAGGMPEQPLGRGVPALNDALERLADNRVVGRFDDRREQPRRHQLVRLFALELPLCGDVSEDQHASRDAAALVPDRRGAVVDRALSAVPPEQQRVIRESDDDAVAERAGGGVVDGRPRALVDDPEHGVERLPERRVV